MSAVQTLKQRSLLILLGAAVASQVDATAQVHARSNHGNHLSTDGSCGSEFAGKGKGMSCPGSTCCSKWGWCGNGPEHCLVGCQSAFGRCDRSENPANRPPFDLPWTGRKHRAPGGFRWRPGSGRDNKGMDRHTGPPKRRYGKGHGSDYEDSDYDSDSGSDGEYRHGRHGRGRHGRGRHGKKGRHGKGRHGKGRHGKGRHGHGGRSRGWRGHSPPPFGRHEGPRGMSHSDSRSGRWPSRGGRISRAWERFKGYRDWDDSDSDSEDEDSGRFLDRFKDFKFPPLGPPLFPPFGPLLGPFPPMPPRPGPPPGVRPGPGIKPGAPPLDPAFANRTKPSKVPYGKIINTCTQPGVVALTFDDGPSTFTGRLLDVLKNNGNVKATFFINGKNAGDLNDQPMKDVIKRMIADGHQIGSHGFSHKSLNPLPYKDKIVEMTKLEAVLKDIIGKMPTYMRPPNFECNDECLKLMNTLGYHVIHENLDTQDFKNTNTIQVSKDIVTKAVDAADSKKSNFIVYANEIHEATVDQLTKHMIEKFKDKGYKFVTVGECLGDPSENWYRM